MCYFLPYFANWYESEMIPLLKMTAQQTVQSGNFEAMKNHLVHIDQGGYA